MAAQPGRAGHPCLIITRDTAIPVLNSVTVALITSTIRDIPTEVVIGPEEGLDHECAINCDDLYTIPQTALGQRRGRLGTEKLFQLGQALKTALGLDFVI